ncbi:hypothetical protein SUGI_1030820 [Cryptomeria japonica]|nr:hypothetical protein SUGI_1030820 [Cryptomeria japonica]
MEDSHSVRAYNMTTESVNSSYKTPRLLGVGFADKMEQACSKEDIVVNQRSESPCQTEFHHTLWKFRMCAPQAAQLHKSTLPAVGSALQ